MLKYSPCIEMIFGEVPFYDRFEAVKAAGLSCAEFWGWTGRDEGILKEKSAQHGVRITSMCVETRDKDISGVFNSKKLLYRDGADAFVSACRESVKMAKLLDVPSLIITVGNERNDVTRYEQHTNIVLAIKKAAHVFEDSGIQLIIEPLNVLCNHMGYFLPSSYETFSIVEEVGSPAVKVLYDIYHQQITEGNLVPTIRKHLPLIGHFHAADVPGRNEPGGGEINYRFVFSEIERLGYGGYVGLEYSPTMPSEQSIKRVMENIS